MNSVLYISYDGLTDPLGQSQILPYLIGLSKKGYRFTIISAEKAEAYQKEKHIVETICEEHQLDWRPVAYTKKPPIVSTLKDVRNIQKLSEKLHKQKQFKAVHCRSYISAMVGLKMKAKFGTKFIFDMRGFWADERIDGKIWNLQKPHYKWVYQYFKKKEKQFLNQADAIISLTHAGKEIMQKQWQVTQPIDVIPCAVDMEHFKPTFENFALKENPTLGYLGSIGTWYMLGEMLDFFKVFQKTYPKAKFKFITKEPKETILSLAESKGLNRESFDIAPALRQDVPKELAKIDLGVFFIKPSFSKQSSSPVKQGEYMSMGIPVITNAGVGDTDEIITKYKSGILVNDFTEAEYQKVVSEIGQQQFLAKDIIEGARQYFSLTSGVEDYYKVYQKIFKA